MLKLLIGVGLSMVLLSAYGADLGIWGAVYPIKEVNLLEFIQKRLQDLSSRGAIGAFQNKMQELARKRGLRPVPVVGITTTSTERIWLFDPSVVVSKQRINPLTTVTLKAPLIFFSGDDRAQVAWALKMLHKMPQAKLILVNGEVLANSKIFGQRIFFDQGGRITGKLHISHTPAVVKQQGEYLQVTEVCP
jgi:conjugal transfer pilus assembly protein TraW